MHTFQSEDIVARDYFGDLREGYSYYQNRASIGFIWLRIETGSGMLSTQQLIFGFSIWRKCSRPGERLSDSQGLCSVYYSVC